MSKLHYAYTELTGYNCNDPNNICEPTINKYDFLYVPIPLNDFSMKDGIMQKTFPISHLYIPNKESISGTKNLYTILDLNCNFAKQCPYK